MLGQAQQILKEYSNHLPLTCRQIYYRMIASYGHPKGKKFQGSLYDMLKGARRAGAIPFASIRDDGIAGRSLSSSVRQMRRRFSERPPGCRRVC